MSAAQVAIRTLTVIIAILFWGCHAHEKKILHDPIEDNSKYKVIFSNIDAEVERELEDHPIKSKIGYCHTFWDTKKRILKEKYGISWKSPAEMNPDIIFD